MSDPRQVLLDEAVRRRIRLGRFGNGLARKTLANLRRAHIEPMKRVAAAWVDDGVDQARIEPLLQEVDEAHRSAWTELRDQLSAALAELAEAEVDFTQRMMGFIAQTLGGEPARPAPSLGEVMTAVWSRPSLGRRLQDWIGQAEGADRRRIREALRQGFSEGQGLDEIARTLRGAKSRQFRDGTVEVSRRGVETMVRAVVDHTTRIADEEVFAANGHLVTHVEWVAVLDRRTTLVCGSRDGKRYRIDEGPRPPAHIGCRSTVVPVLGIDGDYPLRRETYQQWLRRQPKAFQEELLGPGRSDLFRKGKLPLDHFIDDKGKSVSIEQLWKMNAGAFRIVEAAAERAAQSQVFTPEELLAVKRYTGNRYYKRVNDHLRSGWPLSDDPVVAKIVRDLDRAVAKAPLTEDVTVYRGVSSDFRNYYPNLGVGDVIDDAAYVSTSRKLEKAFEFAGANGVVMVITARKGQLGVDVSPVSSVGPGEREILFARGSKLRVVRWDDENQTLYLERL